MAKIRLSGTVLGADDPHRATRAKLLYLLFAAGWDIYNSNGDQRITLSNIEKKIVESDAFVFTPGATLEDMFKAISIFVGFQTLDRNLAGKPAVILNEDKSWDPFFSLLSHLQKMGTVKQEFRDFLMPVDTPEEVIDALKLAQEIRKRQAENEKFFRERAIAAADAGKTGFAKDIAEINAEIANRTTFIDERGVSHYVTLTKAAWNAIIDEARQKLEAFKQHFALENKKALADYLKDEEEAHQRAMEFEARRFQQRIQNDAEIAERNLDHLRQVYAFEEQRAGFERDARLREIEGADAQTLEQKIAVEQRKAETEIDYLEKVHEVRQRLYDMDTSRMLLEEELTLKRLGYQADEIKARIAELSQQREDIRRQNQEATDAAIQAARENAANRAAQLVREHNRTIFESLKQQAGGVFDALLQKSQSVWSAIANSFKTALLTAIKEVVTSRVAAMLMYLFTGQKVTFAGGAAGSGGADRATGVPVRGARRRGGAVRPRFRRAAVRRSGQAAPGLQLHADPLPRVRSLDPGARHRDEHLGTDLLRWPRAAARGDGLAGCGGDRAGGGGGAGVPYPDAVVDRPGVPPRGALRRRRDDRLTGQRHDHAEHAQRLPRGAGRPRPAGRRLPTGQPEAIAGGTSRRPPSVGRRAADARRWRAPGPGRRRRCPPSRVGTAGTAVRDPDRSGIRPVTAAGQIPPRRAGHGATGSRTKSSVLTRPAWICCRLTCGTQPSLATITSYRPFGSHQA